MTDKYGRPLAKTHHADQLKQFYRLRSPSPSAEGEDKDGQFVDYARGEGLLESSGSEEEDDDQEEEEDSDEDEVVEMGAFKKKAIPGQVAEETDDDEESDDEDNFNVDLSEGSDDEQSPVAPAPAETEAQSAFPDEQDQPEAEEDEIIDFTRRFAVVNMDWDNMRAIDLYTVFSSMLQSAQQPQGSSRRRADPDAPVPTGKLLKVTVYPSEFGKERMAKEEAEGPAADVFTAPARTEGHRGKGKGKQIELRPGNSRSKAGRRQQVVEESDLDEEEDDDEEDFDEDVSEGELEDLEDEDEDDMQLGSDEDEGLSEADGSVDDVLGRVRYDSEPEDDESIGGDGEIDMDKLRNYQLERLR